MTVHSKISGSSPWYALFSRGARDWLRHNEKIRHCVQQNLSTLVAGSEIISAPQEQTLHIPVSVLEHARFKLADANNESQSGAGQGEGQPGDMLRSPRPNADKDEDGEGGNNQGHMRLLLEMKVDDIVDWLWEELKLPDLQAKQKTILNDKIYQREGWDRHGARSRLDRRRTAKEAIKRRAIQKNALPFCNEDLRYRQLVQKSKPATHAVVLFLLDVSASMSEAERKLAKSFFYFALQGIRRQYSKVETRFIAHTTQAWEFSESDFFRVTGTGGTGASTAFELALKIIDADYPPSQYNAYLFYASDGENFTEDRNAATSSLNRLSTLINFIGYVETVPGSSRLNETEMKMICHQIENNGAAMGHCVLHHPDDIWKAIRQFFTQHASIHEAG